MADASDVENAIKGVVTAAIYPNGTSSPSSVGVGCQIMRGWPIPEKLDANLKAGLLTISIFGQNGAERNTTRFTTDPQVLDIPSPTIAAAVVGQTITFTGTSSAPQNVGVTLGDWTPAALSVVYPATAADTMTSIAAGLASLLVSEGIPASSAGPVLNLPATAIAAAQVGVFGSTWQEIRRQERVWMVTLWSPSVELRDRASPVVDIALTQAERLMLADGSGATMIYVRTNVSDEKQTEGIYRRDLVYKVEYGTSVIKSYPQIISTNAAVAGSQ